MAQTGNSCSNPYVIDMSDGNFNQTYNITYSDTINYYQVINFSNNLGLNFELDSNAFNNYISDWRVVSNTCFNADIISQNINYKRIEEIKGVTQISYEDTVLLIISIAKISDSITYQNGFNLKIKLNNISVFLGSNCTASTECNNLLLNGSFEEFNPPTLNFTNFQDLGDIFSNYVCNWIEPLHSPDYISPWFNGGCYQIGPQNICNTYGLNPNLINTPVSCGYPAQGSNFYNNSESYSALLCGDNGANGGSSTYSSEILKGKLNTALIQGRKYFFEVDIAKPRRLYYGSKIDFDLTDDTNFIQNNYNNTTNVTLSIEGFDHDPNLNWSRFNTIYQSTYGGEEYLFIGNLRLSPVIEFPSSTSFPLCSQFGGAVYYLIDNIVVKEFFADAGDPNITVCPGTEIGGNTCPFPNGTYEWSPANLFDDNHLYHPTFIGNSNTTVSLTVSIQMEDGTTQISDPSYVNITVGGPSITINGNTNIITGANTTLNASGALTYTWYDITNNIVSTADTYITPNLMQNTTYTVVGLDSNGCSSSIDIEINTISCGYSSNTVIILDGMTSSQLKDHLLNFYPNNITQISNVNSTATFQITSYQAPNDINFVLAGTLIIDNITNLKISNTGPNVSPINFVCFDGSNIINNGYLELKNCSLTACNSMWKGITNNDNLFLNGCYLADAENAVHLQNGSIYNINTNVFENNLYGIFMGGLNGGQISGVDYSNIFRCINQLKPAYTNMFFHPTWSEAGIKVHNVNYVQIGAVPAALANFGAATISNRFENINCGINIFNSNVKVVNSWFKDLTHLNPSPAGTLIGLQPEGSGIYARSIGTPKTLSVEPIPGYSGNEFEKCKYGIKTFRNSIVANNIRMSNVANGIIAQNSIMCSYNLQSNRINAWLNGIEINNAEFANNIVVAYNQINMNFLMGYFGINVTAATSGNFGNTRISNNIVTIANSYNAGIQTSSLKGSLVNCNTVRRTITNPFMTWYSLNGISSLACEKNTLSQNTVNWAPGFNGSPNLGIDLLLELSDEAMINCNTTGVSRIGLQVAGVNNNATIRANNFGSNDIALYYDNSGVTGPQPADPLNDDTEGNRWLGTNTFKAYNTASTSNVQTSIYYVNPNQPAINYPDPQLIFPPNWFDPNGLMTYNAPCLIQNCAGRMASSIGNKDFYRSIANRSLTTNGYPAQTLWMAQNTLVKILTNDSILLNDDDSLQYFYYSPDAQVLRDIDEISRNNNAFEAQRNLFSHAITANDSLLSILEMNYLALNSELTDSLANDSLILMQKITVLAQYESLKQANEDLSYTLNGYHKANLSIANNLNSEIEPRNANEQVLKTVNKIYFALRDSDYEYISYEDSAMIAYIAHLCPLAAGPAVFQARDMYALLVDSVLYQDSAFCSNEGYARESLASFAPKINNNVTEATYFKAFPVPAQNSLNLSFNELKSTAIVHVYDMEGRLMLSININSNSRNAQLELSQVPAGVYYVFLMNNERAERTKITVIK